MSSIQCMLGETLNPQPEGGGGVREFRHMEEYQSCNPFWGPLRSVQDKLHDPKYAMPKISLLLYRI